MENPWLSPSCPFSNPPSSLCDLLHAIKQLSISHKASSPKSMETSTAVHQFRRTSTASQAALEDNVRVLCDMVDSVLRTSAEFSPLRIDVRPLYPRGTYMSQCQESKSSLSAMSPKTFSMAKTAICQVDDAVVSRLSRDTLLNLFPSPPQAPLKSRTTCATCPTAPPTPNTRPVQAPPKYRSRKAGRNRNWVITSGLFLTPPTVDEQEFHFGTSPGMSRASDATLRWSTMKHGLAAPALYPPRHPLSPCSPVSALETLVERQDQDRVVNKQMASGSINKHPASSRKPSTSAPSPVSPLEHLDELSQHLLNIETQLRRPSFLMNGRMSILSTLFTSASEASAVEKHDSRERLLAELSLAVGSVDMPSPSEASIFVIEPVIDTIEQAPCESEEEEMDWRAWHDAWRRRRMKPEHESPSSSTTSLPVPSYSSPNSKSCSPKDSTNNSSAGFLRRRKGKSQDAMGMLTPKPTLKSRKFFSVHSSPSSATPSEGSSTASAEGDNMKWGDRFQMLVQNFQFTAVLHSKKLIDILPKSRWSRRSRARTSPEPNKK